MLITKVDKRYAKSLLDFAREMDKVEDVKADVESILAVMDDSREFSIMLKSPVISTSTKESIMDEIFEGKLNEITANYFKIIARRGREAQLEGILRGFIDLYRQQHNIELAQITVAHPLTESQREAIKSRLAKESGKEIVLSEKVDSSMIGGIKIRLGDKEYNGSIAAQLDKLKRKFASNTFIATF